MEIVGAAVALLAIALNFETAPPSVLQPIAKCVLNDFSYKSQGDRKAKIFKSNVTSLSVKGTSITKNIQFSFSVMEVYIYRKTAR